MLPRSSSEAFFTAARPLPLQKLVGTGAQRMKRNGTDELIKRDFSGGESLIQPAVDFVYEVSFYFINDKLEYALYAPDKAKRWVLKEYPYTDEDAAFAKKFIAWNSIENGIQRVDACKTKDGRLLLVELEDLNPYLSLLDVDECTRNTFMRDFTQALRTAVTV